eukprot:scaffold45992_cov47-Cyclotella_meneghiniana.AAC.1
MAFVVVHCLAQNTVCFVDSKLGEIAPFTVLAQHFHGSTAIFRLLEQSDPFVCGLAQRYFKNLREYGLRLFGRAGVSHRIPACGLRPSYHVYQSRPVAILSQRFGTTGFAFRSDVEELTRLYVQQNATSRQDDDKTTVITMC